MTLGRRPNAWENAIADYEAQDRLAPPVGAVVFTGGSSINWWCTPEQDMAPLPVINWSFGGSKGGKVACYTSRIVLPYWPWAVVVFTSTTQLV
jgi:hypothetical protein